MYSAETNLSHARNKLACLEPLGPLSQPLRSAFLYRLKSFWDLQIDSLLRSDDAEYAVKYRTGSSPRPRTNIVPSSYCAANPSFCLFLWTRDGDPGGAKVTDWNGQVNLAFKILEKDEAHLGMGPINAVSVYSNLISTRIEASCTSRWARPFRNVTSSKASKTRILQGIWPV